MQHDAGTSVESLRTSRGIGDSATIEHLLRATIRALCAAIDSKDPAARGHSLRVSRYAAHLASMLNLSHETVADIELAGLLHDIGKLAIPEEILTKPGRLTAAERVMMMAHASIGADMLSAVISHDLERIVPLVRHHHEWHQGGGYPDGIDGNTIPRGASIIAVAEAFDTMTTDRPYRGTLSMHDALAELQRGAGTQFHPDVVLALRTTIDAGYVVLPLAEHGSAANPAEQRSGTDSGSPINPVDVRTVSVLHRIAGAIASMRDLPVFLDKVVQIISEDLHYGNVSILTQDTNHHFIVVRASTGDPEDSMVGTRVPIDSSITGGVFRSGEVANVSNVQAHADYLRMRSVTTMSEMAVPLIIESRVIGVINVEAPTMNAFTALEERILTSVAAQIAPALELATMHDEYKRAAQRDGLTGVYNHAAFYAHLEAMLLAERQFALFMFDVEGLKRINDTAGHLAGDSVLRRVAAALDLATRPEDMVARYGGDEFAVIVEGIGADLAVDMALRLQATVSQLTWGPQGEQVSISVGVSVAGVDGTSATALVERADQRMYDTRTAARSRFGITTELRERRAPRSQPNLASDDDTL